MNDSPKDIKPESIGNDNSKRCPVCDSVLNLTADGQCLMCGADIEEEEEVPLTIVEPEPKISTDDDRFDDQDIEIAGATESELKERQSPISIALASVLFLTVCILGYLVIQNPAGETLALFPTSTNFPATPSITATMTPLVTDTSPPTDTPTITLTPPPTETPKPPRSHTVTLGETIFSLSLRYGVTMDSIAEANDISVDSGIQVSQQLIIPWPTPTPPLEPVEIEIGGQRIVADPTDCQMYEIKGGDTFFGISSREKVDIQALLTVNRLTEQSVMQPGDKICIPKMIRGEALPPTPGPSPTPTSTQPPAGPYLLYPANGTAVDPPDESFFLQWAAVKDLEEMEWYMVELTDLTDVDSHPLRAFTRQSSFSVPDSWRPDEAEEHVFRWRVRIVQVTGQREDGSFIYTFGGRNSEDAVFTWLGAIPTSTPTPTTVVTPME